MRGLQLNKIIHQDDQVSSSSNKETAINIIPPMTELRAVNALVAVRLNAIG